MLTLNRHPMIHDNDWSIPRFSDIVNRVFERSLNLSNGTFTPEVDVIETNKQFVVTVYLPGLNKDDIEIRFENNVLTVSGERNFAESDDRKYHIVENHYGKFSRSLPFPDIINSDQISANFEDGVLTITMPKLKEKTAKKVNVS